jgi:hypothetical protein
MHTSHMYTENLLPFLTVYQKKLTFGNLTVISLMCPSAYVLVSVICRLNMLHSSLMVVTMNSMDCNAVLFRDSQQFG